MTLPAPNLDDRRFQQFVDDAKRMVQQRCPEWTDHNVSDPGVTLIETFAFMFDQLVYRLNRVPDKLYLKFLELLGVRLFPPTAAQADVTFWLSAPREETLRVAASTSDAAGQLLRHHRVLLHHHRPGNHLFVTGSGHVDDRRRNVHRPHRADRILGVLLLRPTAQAGRCAVHWAERGGAEHTSPSASTARSRVLGWTRIIHRWCGKRSAATGGWRATSTGTALVASTARPRSFSTFRLAIRRRSSTNSGPDGCAAEP